MQIRRLKVQSAWKYDVHVEFDNNSVQIHKLVKMRGPRHEDEQGRLFFQKSNLKETFKLDIHNSKHNHTARACHDMWVWIQKFHWIILPKWQLFDKTACSLYLPSRHEFGMEPEGSPNLPAPHIMHVAIYACSNASCNMHIESYTWHDEGSATTVIFIRPIMHTRMPRMLCMLRVMHFWTPRTICILRVMHAMMRGPQ